MTDLEFYKAVFPNCDSDEGINVKNCELNIERKFLERVSEYLINISDEKIRKNYFKDIIAKPNMDNGKLFELLVYAWLKNNNIYFQKQILIKCDDCLKKNDYYADGTFEGIVFDIKKFGIGYPLYDIFREKLQKEIAYYYITVEGSKNLSAKTIETELMSKVLYWKERLFSAESKLFDDYVTKDFDLGIEIRAHNIQKSEGIITSYSEMDVTRWAQENELYFFRHASQFCINKPYMIICPFLSQDFPFSSNRKDAYYAFRYLCRRMFMNLTKKSTFLRNIDGHAKDHITIQTAAQKLSAIMFLDISEEWDYKNFRCWIYKNPNADFPIPNYIINSKFKPLGAYLDDFKYDNY